jgi:hypothetical protein
VEERRTRLASLGIVDGLAPDLDRARREIAAGRCVAAYDLLEEADKAARRIEEDSLELRSALATTEELWAVGTRLGLSLGGLAERVAHLRRYLAEPSHTAEALAAASQSARELLRLLPSELASAFTAELARNAQVLSRYPFDHPGAKAARHHNAEVTARAHGGSYAEAATLLLELRRTTNALPPVGDEPEAGRATAAGRAVPFARPARSSANVTKATLAEEVRLLAARVRVLTPGSEVAVEAAREIRRAAELVMHDERLDEAHEILLRLIGTINAAALSDQAAGSG